MSRQFVSAGVLEKLREAVDLTAVISDFVRLQKRRGGSIGCCPFHAQARPRFHVDPARKTFRCATCGAHGDAISFLMKRNGWRFQDAVASLSARFLGAVRDLPELEPASAALDCATAWCERLLWEDPRAEPARDHLRRRGILPATARAWRLGYAPTEWSGLTAALQGQGFTTAVLEAAGLAVPRPSGKGHYDRFRGRLMVPIRRDHRVIAFGARLIEGQSEAKYLNSPGTHLYSKGATWFGLDEARSSLVRGETAIVVEGYFDAIALQQAGFGAAVAACGTEVSVAQLDALADAGAGRVVFAFDGDVAGRAAAMRAAEASLGRSMRVAVLICPEGQDPDDVLVSEGAPGMQRRIAAAVPAVDFIIEETFSPLREDTAVETRVAALTRVAGLFRTGGVELTPAQVERVAYLVHCGADTVELAFGGIAEQG